MLKINYEKVKHSDKLQNDLNTLRQWSEDFFKTPIPQILLSEMKEFEKTGTRLPFEKSHFDKRVRLTAFAILSLLDGDKKYLDALEDIIWSICEETSWANIAHYPFDPKVLPISKLKYFIDLSAAETGFSLSEIYCLLGDKLSGPVKQRIKDSVHERIIESYLENKVHFRWETRESNWAAVCACGVGASFLYLGSKEEVDAALPRLLKVMDVYLSGFGDDGACSEGVGYWSYGFSHYVCFADLLRSYTNGKTDLFKPKKIKKIAQFHQKAYLLDNNTVSFSDGPSQCLYLPCLIHYLYNEYDGIEVPDAKYAADINPESIRRYSSMIRNFAWYDSNIVIEGLKEKAYCFLPDVKWYINKNTPFSVAAKAGHNAEQHNHNDVGGIIVYKNKENIFADLGSGLYTRQYFHQDTRYDYLCNSSRGHNVPIINGNYQHDGEEFRGTVLSQDESHFFAEFSKAYPTCGLDSLTRRLDLDEKSVTITDQFVFSETPTSVIERFVTYIKPEFDGDVIKIGNAILTFDSSLEYSFSSELFIKPRNIETTVYLLDFKVKNLQKNIEVKFIIS